MAQQPSHADTVGGQAKLLSRGQTPVSRLTDGPSMLAENCRQELNSGRFARTVDGPIEFATRRTYTEYEEFDPATHASDIWQINVVDRAVIQYFDRRANNDNATITIRTMLNLGTQLLWDDIFAHLYLH